ncbi:MAG: AbrB/MazE/SpoVT family DNA-binding domain-containing protein [Candidatus Bathyarchaeia archaeon]|nr:AbrB/MazE/SpoVT family DNA-binding domain-containing protein [Candidatus Bathyarchaeia archaeon]MDI6905652.1 AbrB/MazE/SpoVT family DNA-binding domain-containing protein [Candidatus Bathyarchaeia archaeon]
MQAYGKVGKKGTLYPPKSLREKLELKEGDMVQYIVKGNNLLVVKISDPLKVASELNIAFDTKKAINIIGEVRKESEREIEEEILKNIKKDN